MGMWSFSSPEGESGESVDARLDDVYRYALVLWATFAARWPFDEALTGEFKTEFEFLRAVSNGLRPPMLRGLSPPVALLLQRLWASEPYDVRGAGGVMVAIHARLLLSHTASPLTAALTARLPSRLLTPTQRSPLEDDAPHLSTASTGSHAPMRRVTRHLDHLIDDPMFAPEGDALGPLPLL